MQTPQRPLTVEGPCWPCTAPRAQGSCPAPSHFCLGPNPDASGQALRTPPAQPRVRPRASKKPGPRVSESSVLHQPDGEAQSVPSPETPPGPAALIQHAPQQQEAPVGQETRAQGSARPQGRRSCVWWPCVQHPLWAAWDGGLRAGPQRRTAPPGARPGPPARLCGRKWTWTVPSRAQSSGGPALALTLTWNHGLAGTQGPG